MATKRRTSRSSRRSRGSRSSRTAGRRIATSQAVRNREVASAVERAAAKWRERGKRQFPDDVQMRRVAAKDATDLRAIAKLVRSNRLQQARDRAAHLDTVVRDELPLPFFGLLTVRGIRW
jgi:hypothetical protein